MKRRGVIAALLAPFVLVPVNVFAQARRRLPYRRPVVQPWEYQRRPVRKGLRVQWFRRPSGGPSVQGWPMWTRCSPELERRLEDRWVMEQHGWPRDLRRDLLRWSRPYRLPRPRKSPAMKAWEAWLKK